MVARGAEEEKHLEELLQRGKTNGVHQPREPAPLTPRPSPLPPHPSPLMPNPNPCPCPGVKNLRIVKRDELFKMEPTLDEARTAA